MRIICCNDLFTKLIQERITECFRSCELDELLNDALITCKAEFRQERKVSLAKAVQEICDRMKAFIADQACQTFEHDDVTQILDDDPGTWEPLPVSVIGKLFQRVTRWLYIELRRLRVKPSYAEGQQFLEDQARRRMKWRPARAVLPSVGLCTGNQKGGA